ncbi:MAG TPA: septal ring lytic transglycosylase RlpA family protein [Terriglobales bacterium]|nr:septal ring lytic transglycosylase RlpA family protein [Terriglobales bacterium]
MPPPPPITPTPSSTTTAQASPQPSRQHEHEKESEEFGPNAKPLLTQTGFASWYGPPYHNRRAANGEIFDMNQLTAAHLTFPMNSIVRVTNLKTHHSTIVRITDRGPFVPDRIIDLSLAAAKAVDVWRPGTAPVRLDLLKTPADLDAPGRWCVQIGAITSEKTALHLKEKLAHRYQSAKVLEFRSPVGAYWVRVRVADDDKKRAEEVVRQNPAPEGNVFLVRLD